MDRYRMTVGYVLGFLVGALTVGLSCWLGA